MHTVCILGIDSIVRSKLVVTEPFPVRPNDLSNSRIDVVCCPRETCISSSSLAHGLYTYYGVHYECMARRDVLEFPLVRIRTWLALTHIYQLSCFTGPSSATPHISGKRAKSAGRESLKGGIFLRMSTWERNERNRAVL